MARCSLLPHFLRFSSELGASVFLAQARSLTTCLMPKGSSLLLRTSLKVRF